MASGGGQEGPRFQNQSSILRHRRYSSRVRIPNNLPPPRNPIIINPPRAPTPPNSNSNPPLLISRTEARKIRLKDTVVAQISSLLFGSPEETFADCKIVLKDGSEVNAHRNLLSARSPVFKAMLTGGLKEASSRLIEVVDISATAMKALLHFIYSGQVLPFTFGSKPGSGGKVDIYEFVYGAAKYQLEDLVQYFDATLGEDDSYELEEVELLFSMTKQFDLKTTREKTMEFVMQHPDLCRKLMEKLV